MLTRVVRIRARTVVGDTLMVDGRPVCWGSISCHVPVPPALPTIRRAPPANAPYSKDAPLASGAARIASGPTTVTPSPPCSPSTRLLVCAPYHPLAAGASRALPAGRCRPGQPDTRRPGSGPTRLAMAGAPTRGMTPCCTAPSMSTWPPGVRRLFLQDDSAGVPNSVGTFTRQGPTDPTSAGQRRDRFRYSVAAWPAAGDCTRTRAARINAPHEHRNGCRRSAGSRGAPLQAGQSSRGLGRRLLLIPAPATLLHHPVAAARARPAGDSIAANVDLRRSERPPAAGMLQLRHAGTAGRQLAGAAHP